MTGAGDRGDHNRNGLTGPGERIQWPAASGGADPASDADEAVLQAFIDTLARIALAVASRETPQASPEEESGAGE